MRRFSLLHPLWLAFYDGAIYEDVARHWRNRVFLYLLLLLALTWIPVTIQIQNVVDEWVSREAPFYIDQVPDMTLSDGELSTSSSTPTILRNRDGTVMAVIDPTGRYNSLADTEAPVLVTRTQIFIRGEGDRVEVTPLPQGPPETLTREDLYVLAGWTRSLVSTLLFPILLVVSYAFRTLQALLYAYVASFFTGSSGGTLPYRTLLNIAIIAITPAIVLDTVHTLMETPLPGWFWWPACVVLSLGYLRFGIRVTLESEGQAQATV